jgi:NADPH:quinone reductase-like Zn-dependent oxidoreductase
VAGEVVEVGPGVKSFKAGDKVVAALSHAVSTIFILLPLYYTSPQMI